MLNRGRGKTETSLSLNREVGEPNMTEIGK